MTITAFSVRIVLVRHGETEEAMRGRCCGRIDPPLSRDGLRDMSYARECLSGLAVAAVYASPRRRAVDSARALEVEAPLTVDERLREIDFGCLEGLTFQEIAARHPGIWRQWIESPTEVAFPQGETFRAFADRVDLAVDDLLARHQGHTIAIVAHGGVNRLILARALQLDLRRMFALQQSCGSVSVIDRFGDQAIVQVMNATGRTIPAC